MNTALTLALTAASLALGWLISRYYSDRKGLGYYLEENRIISPFGFESIADLDVIFRGTKVNGLSQIKLAVWNSGNSALKREHISTIDPFGFVFPDSKILDTVQLLESCKSIGASSQILDNKLVITFEMLDTGDSIVVAALIDTVKEDRSFSGVFETSGKIEGLSSGPYRSFSSRLDYDSIFFGLMTAAGGLYSLTVYGSHLPDIPLYVLNLLGIIDSYYLRTFIGPIIALMGVVLVLTGGASLYTAARKMARRPPKFVREHLGLRP